MAFYLRIITHIQALTLTMRCHVLSIYVLTSFWGTASIFIATSFHNNKNPDCFHFILLQLVKTWSKLQHQIPLIWQIRHQSEYYKPTQAEPGPVGNDMGVAANSTLAFLRQDYGLRCKIERVNLHFLFPLSGGLSACCLVWTHFSPSKHHFKFTFNFYYRRLLSTYW